MTFDSKLLLRVDIKNKLFSFLFNNLPPLSCFAYSKASKVGNACGRRQSKDKAKNSEVLKRVNSDQGLLSTYEFLCVRFKSLVLQRSSTFEAFEYAKREKGQTWAREGVRKSNAIPTQDRTYRQSLSCGSFGWEGGVESMGAVGPRPVSPLSLQRRRLEVGGVHVRTNIGWLL